MLDKDQKLVNLFCEKRYDLLDEGYVFSFITGIPKKSLDTIITLLNIMHYNNDQVLISKLNDKIIIKSFYYFNVADIMDKLDKNIKGKLRAHTIDHTANRLAVYMGEWIENITFNKAEYEWLENLCKQGDKEDKC